jgi:putative transposase
MNHKPRPRKASGGRPTPGYSLTRNGKKVSDEQIKEWLMEAIESDGFAYGYLKLTHLLRREHGLVINKKKVYRLCQELDVLKPQRQVKRKYPRKLARNRIITAPNQLWEVDLKYGYIAGEDRFFFILSYIDVYDRQIVGYHIGLRCEAHDVVQALKMALWRRQIVGIHNQRLVIRSDNGPQFVSLAFENACEQLGLEHERIPPRTPNLNAHIESFHRILEEECLSGQEFDTYAEAYEAVDQYIRFYNERRLHSSLNYLPPQEFHRKHYVERLKPTKVVKV